MEPMTNETVWIFNLRTMKMSRGDVPSTEPLIDTNDLVGHGALRCPDRFDGDPHTFAYIEWMVDVMRHLSFWFQKRIVEERANGNDLVYIAWPIKIKCMPLFENMEPAHAASAQKLAEETLLDLFRVWWNRCMIRPDAARLLVNPDREHVIANYVQFASIREIHFGCKSRSS